MPKQQYYKYARDVLAGLITAPSAASFAPSDNTPYVRFELEFPTDDAPPVQGSFTAMLKGKPLTTTEPDEVRELANNINAVLKEALKDDTQKLTIEASVVSNMGGVPGRNVSFFVYSDSHKTPEYLQAYLRKNEKNIMARFNQQFSTGTGGPAA